MALRNIGIFAHVDAGKTTLTEQMLLCTGAIRTAGSVDRGTAHTDTLPVERRRGISVKSATVSFTWKGVTVNLIDTPGHTDFSAEIERSFWALDAAILVVDAFEGVQPQTEALYRALKQQNLPFLFFLNKTDREGADAHRTLLQLRRRLNSNALPLWDQEKLIEFLCETDDALMLRFLDGELFSPDEIESRLAALTREGIVHPTLYGSGLRGQGIEALLDAVISFLPEPQAGSGTLSGVVFSAAQDRLMGRGLWIRLFSGRLANRMALNIRTGTDRLTGEPVFVQRKITQIRSCAGSDTGSLDAGSVGLVFGLGDLSIGHIFGDASLLPRKVQPGLFRTPLITVRVAPQRAEQMPSLIEACAVLSGEDPLLNTIYEHSTGELRMQVMGKIQLEILQEILKTRFDLTVSFDDPSVIYRETIARPARGFVAYTMPKPCWAVLEFDIRPAPRGSGVSFHSSVAGRDIMPRYQHQVEQAIPRSLSQGRLGWQVTDVDITLVGGNHHLIHTHPLDFIVATPMAIQDGLRQGGSVLLEPIYSYTFIVPVHLAGRVISDVQQMRGELVDTAPGEDTVTLTALVPVASSMDYSVTFAAFTGGKGSISASLHSYRACDLHLGKTCPRRGVDPLDTAKYILAARSALEGDIFG